MKMDDRRIYKRFSIDGMDVQCRMNFTPEVKMVNISLGGALLRSSTKLDMGSKYTFKIDCPGEVLTILATVVWERIVNLSRNEEEEVEILYDVGIEFDNVLTDTGMGILNFLENTCQENELFRLKGMRLDLLESEKTTILDYQRNFNVVKLSKGGMLVETEYKLKVDSRSRMEIKFSDEDKCIRFLGRIASCEEVPGSHPRLYHTGIEIIQLSEEDKRELDEFIDFLGSL